MADKPFGRLAHPEEIGNLIAFAASGRSSYMSGTIIVIDGGASVGKYPNEASTPKAKDGMPKLRIGDTS